MSLIDRTSKAFGNEVMDQLRNLRFCIVGCGGTGAAFAEMLVRSGARRLILIDGSDIKCSGLNRLFFCHANDVGKPKVDVLKQHLESITQNLEITAIKDSFRLAEDILEGHAIGQQVRDEVHDSDIVFIGTDTNESRLAIEELRNNAMHGNHLSCGIRVDAQAGEYIFECNWNRPTPPESKDDAGYGPENASYAAIVMEAVSVAFSMLISHLRCPDSGFRSYWKRYDANFVPVEISVNGTSNDNRPS